MKNIHLISTDKPSRFSLNSSGKYYLTNQLHTNSPNFTNQNIYITNDEEIKEGDWQLSNDKHITIKTNSFHESDKKIILTTDQDLIKDGVQEVEDEFLEWFVKNPTCEWVEIVKGFADGTYYGFNFLDYKIIIPKEESKQETIEQVANKQWGNVHRTGVLGFIEGAKWQQERMYSEEEVLVLLHKRDYYNFKTNEKSLQEWETPKEWFEQFKK